jgi:hypothetical protein
MVWLISPGYRFPNWLNEGLAEYYGASVWDAEKEDLTVGGLLEGRLAGVQADILKDDWVHIEDMMPYPNIPGQYYGWAWTFVHFMMNSKYEKKFKRLVLGFPRDKSHDRERIQYTGTFAMEFHPPEAQWEIMKRYLRFSSVEDLEKEWHDYVRTLEPASPRGFYQAGRRALLEGMPLKAIKMMEMAKEKGYDSPLMYSKLAEAWHKRPKKDKQDRLEHYRQAVAHMESAVERDPVNPLFHAKFARMLDRAARAAEKGDPRILVERELARELGEFVNGGEDSYSVFLELDWEPYNPDRRTGSGN